MRMILNIDQAGRRHGPARAMAILAILSLALTVAACSSAEPSEADGPTIVATTSIVGDLVSQVAGDEGDVEVIMGRGVDPHDFQASARQVALLEEADLVIGFGLGLEESLLDVLDVGSDRVLLVGPEVDPIPFHGEPHDDDHSAEAHEGDDPHVWQDPVRMATAVGLIGARLEAIAPGGGWEARAEAYAGDLLALDDRTRDRLSAIAPDRRKLVTSHDSLGYYADRYGFEIIGVIIPGGSTLGEPSASDLADLVESIEREDVPAIFTEAFTPVSLADAVSSEVGRDIAVVELITGALTDEADSYIEMIETNTTRIVEALGAR